MRSATAYQRGEGIYLHSNSQTTYGVWVAAAPYIRLPVDTSADELGKALEQTLSASRIGLEHPDNWDAIQYPLPKLAGVASWATFMRKARCASVKDENGVAEVTPNQNLGPDQGFEPIEEAAIVVRVDSYDQVGSALLNAFQRCS